MNMKKDIDISQIINYTQYRISQILKQGVKMEREKDEKAEFIRLLKEHGDYEAFVERKKAQRRSNFLIFLSALNFVCSLLLVIMLL